MLGGVFGTGCIKHSVQVGFLTAFLGDMFFQGRRLSFSTYLLAPSFIGVSTCFCDGSVLSVSPTVWTFILYLIF